jgi:hypothetical protein
MGAATTTGQGTPDAAGTEATRQLVSAFMDALLGYTVSKAYRERELNAYFTADIELVLPGTSTSSATTSST